MPFIELGTDAKLKLSIPSKGDTNWSEEIKTSCFQKIVDHDHTTGKGVRIPTGGIDDLAVTTAKLAVDAVTGAKIADDQIDSEHYIDGSIDLAHLAADSVDGTKIADDAINSEHYVDGSIDTAHIADLQVTTGKLAADAITEAKLADDAVQVEHKKTISQTLAGTSPTTITGITVSADQALKLNYRIHNTGTTTAVQVGTLTGQAGDYITDEFTGTDIASFSWSGTNLQLTGVANDVLEYSIEFLE